VGAPQSGIACLAVQPLRYAEHMQGSLLFNFESLPGLLQNPVFLILLVFQIWMLVDAVRRGEWFWAVLIFLFSALTAALYFFFVYRNSPSLGGGGFSGFELPGAHDRRRIKELQDKIHHLDKAPHHLALGDIYFQQGKLALAETHYRAAIERDADDVDIRAHLGQCLLRLGRTTEARPLLEGVVAETPRHDYGHTLMALAEALTALGDRAAAKTAWERVLESNSYPRARVQLAELRLAEGDVEAARRDLREVIDEDKHAPAFQRKRERFWITRAKRLLG
jgi:hypothetical protein